MTLTLRPRDVIIEGFLATLRCMIVGGLAGCLDELIFNTGIRAGA